MDQQGSLPRPDSAGGERGETAMEQLEAAVQGTVFRNEENGYTVLTVLSGRQEVTVVGSLPELSPGEQVVFTGEWTEHRAYGRQFKCAGC